ncbi:MAG: TetR/AcrR family transcriptional regulator [Sandaracinaceae bacterium]|nr:TetR/AcrR family transcriptional regulator [Sandaracinaceae bacterium]
MSHASDSSSGANALRKRPVQARSRRRFDAILAAAGELFAEHGVEATAMEAIAARAGTSIGSVYQYFPDKRAVFVALAEQVLERSRATFDALVLDAEPMPWPALIDRAVDVFAAMLGDPSLRAVWMNLQRYGEVLEADHALHEELIERTTEILRAYAKDLRARDRRRVATMVVDVIASVLFMATHREPERSGEMIREVKVLLRRYLAPYAEAE